MPNLRLPLILALTAICVPASAQNPAFRKTSADQFPGGLQVRQVDHEVLGPVFDPQAGAAVFDEGTIYYDHPADQPYLDVFDPTALPADCGNGCPPAWTAELEGFYLNREGDDRFSASVQSVIPSFDYEPGARITLHRHYDCLEGWDVTYAGGWDWFERDQIAGANLNSVFGVQGVNISTFNGATQHSQSMESSLESIELTRKWYGWDVFAVGLGVRYLNLEEEFLFRSVSPAGVGALSVESNNHLGGLQLLLELKVPIGRWTSQARLKGGLFANAADSETLLANAGTLQIANSDDDIEFASIIEFGYFQRYRVSDNVYLQAGYEVWWLYGLALAQGQLQGTLTPLTGAKVDGNGDTWYHGGTFGMEVIY